MISKLKIRFNLYGINLGCGGDLTTPSGSFVSPNYPSPYHHNVECYWTITTSRGSRIVLRIDDFNLEAHSNCAYDYLQVNTCERRCRWVISFKCFSFIYIMYGAEFVLNLLKRYFERANYILLL